MSENIQVMLKSENEIDKQEIETLIKVLKKADVADNAVIMLKEIEQEQDEIRIKSYKKKIKQRKNKMTITIRKRYKIWAM